MSNRGSKLHNRAARVRHHRVFLIVLALPLILPASAQQQEGAPQTRHQTSQFTGTYTNRTGDWKILDLGDGKLRVTCSLTYLYKVRGLLTAHTGEGSGEAALTGKTAVFKPDATTACTITLRFVGDKLIVKQQGSDADCGFGHKVYANGTYRRQTRRPPKFDMEK